MKMIMTIVPKLYAEETLTALINAGFTASFIETRGGMLRQSQVMMFSGVRAEDVDKALAVINSVGGEDSNLVHRGYGIDPKMPAFSGPVVFVWSLDSFPGFNGFQELDNF